MYVLYHHFLQKVKEDEIRKYNQIHRDYLIRSGKIVEQPVERKPIRNQNVNRGNYQPTRPTQRVDHQMKESEISVEVKPGPVKPRRQRQFNRPNQNSQPDPIQPNTTSDNQPRVQKRGEFTRPRPNRVEAQQQQISRPIDMDRPIKQNKLTPEQIEYLNQSTYNQNPPQIKKPAPKQKPIPQPQQKAQFQNELPPQYQQIQLLQCSICHRKFKQQALMKHENICQKVFQQKRKPFEVKTTDEQAEKLKKKSQKENSGKNQKKDQQQPKWKSQSQIFRNMLKKGRGEKVENQIVEEDTRIPCPGCGRKFNDKAAAKHIEFCTKKPKKPNKN